MMRKLCLALAFLLFTFIGSLQKAAAEDVITLTLPESVIAKAVIAILPLRIDAHSKSLKGDIIIRSITDFQLSNNQLACRLHLAGSNLGFVTEIAGHEIKLKVGAVEIEVQTNATLRYDAAQQILFVKPVVKNLSPGGKDANADIGQALVALLNGKEFPVTLQNLDPIIAKSGAKIITINTRITDIKAQPEALRLSLVPIISAK
ncbi:MAG: hypothetical protein KJ630_23130 [Proteobacteria bacterium]|nr:hypothetical protein [Pseudomonadota bacterium]